MGVDMKFKFTGQHPIHGYPVSDENAIILLARDAATPDALEAYRQSCRKRGACQEHFDSVGELIERVKQFQAEHGTVTAGLYPAAKSIGPTEPSEPVTQDEESVPQPETDEVPEGGQTEEATEGSESSTDDEKPTE